MYRLAPPLAVLVLVTTLLLGYGSYSLSWIAGPIAALLIWSFDRKSLEVVPGRVREPAPVD